MNEFEIIIWIMNALKDELIHFWLAFFVGALAYWLILTMFYAGCWVYQKLTSRKTSSAVASFIRTISLLGSLALALLSHYFLDFLVIAYTTPLGKPLELIK